MQEKLMPAKGARIAKALRWAGRIIALPVVAFFFMFMVGDFVSTLARDGLRSATDVGGLMQGITILIALIGCIISWWRLLPAGSLLILAYLFGGISSALVARYHVGMFNYHQFGDFWQIPGIIYLIAGLLFIVSWSLATKARSNTQPGEPGSQS